MQESAGVRVLKDPILSLFAKLHADPASRSCNNEVAFSRGAEELSSEGQEALETTEQAQGADTARRRRCPVSKQSREEAAQGEARLHVARFRFRNGYGTASAVVQSDIDRVWSAAQHLDGLSTYVVFKTTTRHVAVNLRHLSAIQFDGRPG